MNHFAYPWAFALLLLPFIWRRLIPAIKGLHGDALRVPFIADLEKISIKAGGIWKINDLADGAGFSRMFWLLYVVWTFLVVAVARPQWLGEPVRLKNESRDIMLVLDISTSMLNQDFFINQQRIDRLTAVKKTASDFIKKRANDRIGLVAFAGKAKLCSPLTLDHGIVTHIIREFYLGTADPFHGERPGYISEDGTAIGTAIASAATRLNERKETKSKVIILVTDGMSNRGSITPTEAAEQAKELGIKIFTIAIGMDKRLSSYTSSVDTFDEKTLREIAKITGGRFYRASSGARLQKAFESIDKLEKTEAKRRTLISYDELFPWPLGAALLLLSMGVLLHHILPKPAP